MTFCPQAVAWGDVATWLAAAATFLAVMAALRTAKHAGDVALRIHENEQKVRREKDDSLRHQLAIAFDSELHMVIHELDFFCVHVAEALANRSQQEIEVAIKECHPSRGLSLLSRFSDRLDVFPIGLAGELLAILSRWNMVHQAPEPAFSSEDQAEMGAHNALLTMDHLRADMRTVRARVREHVLPGTQLTPEL